MKWRKAGKQGNYISDGLLGLEIIKDSFGFEKHPWKLVTKQRTLIDAFPRLKDAKAYAETLDETEDMTNQDIKDSIKKKYERSRFI